MSKSLGNFITLRELLFEYPGEVIRTALLSAHYRAPLDWSEQTLQQAHNNLDRFYQVLRAHPSLKLEISKGSPKESTEKLLTNFHNAIGDDLNTPQAFVEIHALANRYFKTEDQEAQREIATAIQIAGDTLGLLQEDPEIWFKGDGKKLSISEEKIEQLIQERLDARAAKDFQKADQIRNDLLNLGIELEDTKDGTRWQAL